MGDEPDKPLARSGRRHEFADGIKQWFELNLRSAAEGVVRQRKPFRPALQVIRPLPDFDAGVHAGGWLRWYCT